MEVVDVLFVVAGTRLIPCDFLIPVVTHNPVQSGLHHQVCTQIFVSADFLQSELSWTTVSADCCFSSVDHSNTDVVELT